MVPTVVQGCSSDYETTSITYDKAGTTALQVGSNKTLMGKGSNAGLKGKGLHITDQSNIIIQNIKISTSLHLGRTTDN